MQHRTQHAGLWPGKQYEISSNDVVYVDHGSLVQLSESSFPGT